MNYSDIEKSFENTSFSKEQKAFIIAKSWHEFLTQQKEEIKKFLIENYKFYYPESSKNVGFRKGQRIRNPNHLCFLTRNKDSWKSYYDLFYAECQKRGIARKYNETITSESRKMLLSAGNVLIDWFLEQVKNYAPNTKDFSCLDSGKVKKHILYRQKILDLAMKWKV